MDRSPSIRHIQTGAGSSHELNVRHLFTRAGSALEVEVRTTTEDAIAGEDLTALGWSVVPVGGGRVQCARILS